MPAPKRPGQATVTAQLATHAKPRPVNNLVGVGKYYHSAECLLRQADFYRAVHDDMQLYVFLMRFVSLLVETLPRHQDFRKEDPKYQRFRKHLVQQYMPELERLKLQLNLNSAETPKPRYQHPQRPAEAVQTSLSNLPGLDWAKFTYPGYSNSNGEYSTAQQRPSGQLLDLLTGVEAAPSAPSSHLLPSEPEVPGRRERLPTASIEALQRHALVPAAPERRRPFVLSPAAVQRHLYPSFDISPPGPIDYGLQATMPSASPLNSSSADGWQRPTLMDDMTQAVQQLDLPEPPAQLQSDLQQQVATDVKPQLELQLGPQELPVDMVSPIAGDPCCPVPQHAPSPLEKDFEGMRDVNVSLALMEDFMRLCVANTQRNIETIGLLGGTLSPDGASFNINTLILPKQKGETDRVEMLKEEEIWDIFFQDGQTATQSLFPVGWIHTHPAFDCFLSSVDIHNQYGYQVMLEEAVAIVMSPRDSKNRKCGIFRLTTPGGMSLIKECSQTGFHTHPPTSTGQKIYELCGHVYINPRVPHKVVDLRS